MASSTAKEKAVKRDMFYTRLLELYNAMDEKDQQIMWIRIGLGISYFNVGLLCFRYVWCLLLLKSRIVCNNIFYIVFASLFPVFIWLWSTRYKKFSYYNMKLFRAGAFCVNAVLCVYQPVYTVVWRLITPFIMKHIKVTAYMTEDMLIMLVRILLMVVNGGVLGVVFYNIFTLAFNAEGSAKIAYFKINHAIDMRRNRENLYDFTSVKNLVTGETVRVHEDDRFLHTLINGTTGVGKTSSTLLVSINDDLEKKKKNMEEREKAYLKLVKEGKADVVGPCKPGTFMESYIVPKKGFKKEYDRIRKTYPDCGLTVMAPDPDTTDAVIQIATAKGFRVNVIDPEPDENGKKKAGLIGMNPFYIAPGQSEIDEVNDITMKAQYFYDVMSAMASSKGSSSDQYFEGVNNTVAVSVAKIVMKGMQLREGRQATIMDVRRCISDFSELIPYCKAIQEHYNLTVDVKEKTAKSSGGGTVDLNRQEMADHSARKKKATGKDRRNWYYDDISLILNDFLGESSEKWNRDAMGLRTLLKNFVNSPRIVSILTMDQCIDFAKILKDSEITVVNTSLVLGSSLSTAFGLFFLLNMKQAVMSRPKSQRPNHFWYIDEFALFLSSEVEQMFTIFRKYRCAMTVAIQTLDQFDKNAVTRYLKGVLIGNCATHILFGRGNISELKIYSDLAGTEEIQLAQKTVSQTSMLNNNASYSESERITPTSVNILEQATIRNRDFQEVTMFSVEDGRVLRPIVGQTDFLARSFYDASKQVVRHVRWDKHVTKYNEGKKVTTEDLKNQTRKKTSLSLYSGNKKKMVHVVKDASRTSLKVMAPQSSGDAGQQAEDMVRDANENVTVPKVSFDPSKSLF